MHSKRLGITVLAHDISGLEFNFKKKSLKSKKSNQQKNCNTNYKPFKNKKTLFNQGKKNKEKY